MSLFGHPGPMTSRAPMSLPPPLPPMSQFDSNGKRGVHDASAPHPGNTTRFASRRVVLLSKPSPLTPFRWIDAGRGFGFGVSRSFLTFPQISPLLLPLRSGSRARAIDDAAARRRRKSAAFVGEFASRAIGG